MDIAPAASQFSSLIPDLLSNIFNLIRPQTLQPAVLSSQQDLQQLAQDSFLPQETESLAAATYQPARPVLTPGSDSSLNQLLGLLNSLSNRQGTDSSFVLRIRQSAAFALQASSVMNSLPANSAQGFGRVSRNMISKFLRDAQVLFKTLVEFARQAQKLGSKGQPSLQDFLRVVEKLLDAFPDLLNSFMPAFASAEDGASAQALDFLQGMGSGDQNLNFSGEINFAASFLAQVEITIDSGDFHLQFSASASVDVQASASVQQQQADPIVIDTTGQGVALSPDDSSVPFDITGDGSAEQVQLPSAGSLLALDSNDNGVVDDGRELFGTQNGAANGFDELAKYDSNRDRIIDALDPIFDRLLLFTDSNRDGRSQPGELLPLLSAGISALFLDYENSPSPGQPQLAQHARFQKDDGSIGNMWDVLLNYMQV